MKRLTIKKLIVISQSESRSLEVPFENGLNIILGGNKTGKSSIIKSLFITLGCECRRVEADWEKLISYYLLFFDYGEKNFVLFVRKINFRFLSILAEHMYVLLKPIYFMSTVIV